jgi:hypothetical protein
MNTPTESPLVQRLRGYVAAAEAMEANNIWQYLGPDNKWVTPQDQTFQHLKDFISEHHALRPAPEPVTRAWTLDTAPLNQVIFVQKKREKHDKAIRFVGAWHLRNAEIFGYGFIDYATLHTDWLRADGSVCGTVEGDTQ